MLDPTTKAGLPNVTTNNIAGPPATVDAGPTAAPSGSTSILDSAGVSGGAAAVTPTLAIPVAMRANGWVNDAVAAIIEARTPASATSEAEAKWLREVVMATRTAFQQFQLNSKVVGEPKLTPNAAIIRFQGAANMTVEHVLKRRSELLTTYSLNVISVRGEPGAVSISVARPERQTLHTLDVWKQWAPPVGVGNHRLLVAVNEDDSSPLFVSPTENAPHTLIAGATGSGKSVLMQNIILSIACTNTSAQARIVLIDPKMGVDYFAFEGLPHLGTGLIEEQNDAIETLNGLLCRISRDWTPLIS